MLSKNQRLSSQEQVHAHRTAESRARVLWLKIVLLLFFVVIAARLAWIQVIQHPKYKEIAKQQYEVRVPLPATRGNIYDRTGKILVSSSMAISYAADTKMLGRNIDVVAQRFASVFGKPKETYLNRLWKKDARFVWLERRADPATSSRISTKEFDGLIAIREPKRIYHYDHVAGQALGFTDVDNKGLSGLELEFDQHMKGRDGYIIMQRDGLGRARPTVDYPRVEPVNGNSIVLTIDLDMQSIAEGELRKGIERNNATGGIVVMLVPKTGEVLAMASAPSINPNFSMNANPAAMKNRSITDIFEPGSVFKLVTVSAAIENNLISDGQQFSTEKGKYKKDGRYITEAHKPTKDRFTLKEAVEQSSNIVMAKVSDLIGAEKFYRTARSFGFGISTGLELPGEVSGQLKKPDQWSRTTLNTMAYGYEVGATAMQIAAAYAAVANGGVLMKPYIVKQILNEQNEVESETSPQTIRRVISRTTADTLRSFLRGVVERGSATAAKSQAIMIAGKTGTSRKIIDGKYSTTSYTASFVGIFPADDPQVVCLVMLDNPKAMGYFGGYTSAPIVKSIAEKVSATSDAIVQQLPAPNVGRELFAVPDVRTLDIESATNKLESLGFAVETSGSGTFVFQQTPPPGAKIASGELVRLVTERKAATVAGGFAIVPNVKGHSLRRALNLIMMARLDAEVNGSGVVTAQSPAAGQQVKVGTRMSIQCDPIRVGVLVSK